MNYPEVLKPQIERALRSDAPTVTVERTLAKVRGAVAALNPAQPDAPTGALPNWPHDAAHRQAELVRLKAAAAALEAKLAA